MANDPIRFLIVDDRPANLIALESLIRRDGLLLLKARSGSEALELLLQHDIDLAILDVQMPDMDGFELAELMRGAGRNKHVPIIFVTAGGRDSRRQFKGYEAGAVDFLYKPIDERVLLGKLEAFFELARQRRELASALRLNEMFVGILGHDLRNPLSAMLAGTQLLAQQLAEPTAQRTLFQMNRAGQRMGDMIEQLLDLTRARLGGGIGATDTRVRVDLSSLVQRAGEELGAAHPARTLRFEQQGESSAVGDADRLLQLFSNLLANALQHGTAGTPVTVMVDGLEAAVRVSVHNHGVIPAELLPGLFEPFRGRIRASRSHGLGLGLFIAQQIALAHGGRLEVTSNEREGTTFVAIIARHGSRARAGSAPHASPLPH